MQLRLCIAIPRSVFDDAHYQETAAQRGCLPIPLLHTETDTDKLHYPISLTCDSAVLVRELARKLVCSFYAQATYPRTMVFTLKVTDVHQKTWVADPGESLINSRITDGCCISPEHDEIADGQQIHARLPVARLTAQTSGTTTLEFLLREGLNTLGRDRTNHICIPDSRVSRLHASLFWRPAGLTVQDRGSSNGTTVVEHGRAHLNSDLTRQFSLPVHLNLGGVRAEITPLDYSGEALRPTRQTLVIRKLDHHPQVTEPSAEISLPEIPQQQTLPAFPVISAATPAVIGATLFIATQSLMSLIGVAVSPVIAIATWCEQFRSRNRTYQRAVKQFQSALADSARQLGEYHAFERYQLCRSYPQAIELAARTRYARTGTVWLRCGSGLVASTAQMISPKIPHQSDPLANSVHELVSRSRTVLEAPVTIPALQRPVLIIGDRDSARGLLRSFLIQAAAQCSPKDVTVFFVTETTSAQQAWLWAAWLPHVQIAENSPMLSPFVSCPSQIAALFTLLHHHFASALSQPSRTGQIIVISDEITPDLAALLDPFIRPAENYSVVVWACSSEPLFPEPAEYTLIDFSRGTAQCSALTPTHLKNSHAIRVTDTSPNPQKVLQTQTVSQVFYWEYLSIADSLSGTLTLLASQTAHPAATPAQIALSDNRYSQLPDVIRLSDLLPHTDLRSPAMQLKQWKRNSIVAPNNQIGSDSPQQHLAAVVGVSGAEPIIIDLRKQGPHALVAGTTGSGKSEFLQSWIISLAATYPPDRLVFFLMDYKGGAAFAECEHLPHVAGYVTDLTASLARRAHAALTSEIVRREKLLLECGASDIETLELRGDRRAPPNLVVVVDECAVLLREYPAAREVLHDIAQRGRSLGMHLILATQRPAGIVSDQLRANTSIRVSLRVADVADSVDLIGSAEAAHIPQRTPGRAYLRFGSDKPIFAQTAYVGLRHPSNRQPDIVLRKLALCGRNCTEHVFGSDSPKECIPPVEDRTQPTDASKIRDRLLATAVFGGYQRPSKLWCDPLPNRITTTQLKRHLHPVFQPSAPETQGFAPEIGLLDLPHEQKQTIYSVPLTQAGNVLISGAARSGKSTTLYALAFQLLQINQATWVYLLVSDPFSTATPHTEPDASTFGISAQVVAQRENIVNVHDADRLTRVFSLLESFLTIQPLTSHRPHILLLIDDLVSLRETLERNHHEPAALNTFHELLRHGRVAGITVVGCIERVSALSATWLTGFPTRICHRVIDIAESHLSGISADAAQLASLPQGRALVQLVQDSPAVEVQIAIPTPPKTTTRNQHVWPPAPTVPSLPNPLLRNSLESQYPGSGFFAYNLTEVTPLPAPQQGLCVVTGRPGSGRTQSIRSLTETYCDRAKFLGSRCPTILLAIQGSGRFTKHQWSLQVHDFGSAVTALHRAHADAGHAVLVIESGVDEALLTAQLPLLCQSLPRGILVILETPYRLSPESWKLKSLLRESACVLALRPDPLDPPCTVAQQLPRNRGQESSAGRGVWVSAQGITPVQIALPSDCMTTQRTRSTRAQNFA